MSTYVKNEGSSGLQNLPKSRRGYQADQPLTGLLDLTDDLEDMADLGIGPDANDPIAAALAPKPRKQQPTRAAKPTKNASSTQKRTKTKTARASSRSTTGAAPSPKAKTGKAAAPRKATHQRPPMRKSKTHDLKATAAPLLATVGVLLLVPAIWAALLLIGVGVPGAARDDARPMAAVMLASWPIAICLIAASVVFFKQIIREKKRLQSASA